MWQDDALVAESCDRWAPFATRRRLADAGVIEDLLDASFESYRPRNASQEHGLVAARAFAADAQPTDRMLITGTTGLGKSHLAVAALRVLAERGSVMFAYMPAFVADVRAEMLAHDTTTFDRAVRVDYLVMDDVGADRATEYVREQIELLLTLRMKRSVIFTYNQPTDRVVDAYGSPVMRRIVQNTSTVVELEGEYYDGQ